MWTYSSRRMTISSASRYSRFLHRLARVSLSESKRLFSTGQAESASGESRRFGVAAFRRPTHGRRWVGDGALSSAWFAVENSAVYFAKRRRRCSPHALGSIRVKSPSCISLGCRPSSMASRMSGARSVSRSRRLTKLRVTVSASASSETDRHFPCSSSRFHRCARTIARISASSGRGFAGAQARRRVPYLRH
jgi:hypothetical protein